MQWVGGVESVTHLAHLSDADGYPGEDRKHPQDPGLPGKADPLQGTPKALRKLFLQSNNP